MSPQPSSDEVGDILAMEDHPSETKREAGVYVASPFKLETDERPILRVKGQLTVCTGHVIQLKVGPPSSPLDEITHITGCW